MRVVAGRAKGRRLVAPPGDVTRPTSDFVREAIFNSLQGIVDLEGSVVADLFAGTGALGIEALSRGAVAATFVESDRRALQAIRTNLQTIGLPGGAVVQADAVAWVTRLDAEASFDVVFCDPPYAFTDWTSIGAVGAGVLVAESDREVDVGSGWEILRSKRYGSTVVTLFEPRRTL